MSRPRQPGSGVLLEGELPRRAAAPPRPAGAYDATQGPEGRGDDTQSPRARLHSSRRLHQRALEPQAVRSAAETVQEPAPRGSARDRERRRRLSGDRRFLQRPRVS